MHIEEGTIHTDNVHIQYYIECATFTIHKLWCQFNLKVDLDVEGT